MTHHISGSTALPFSASSRTNAPTFDRGVIRRWLERAGLLTAQDSQPKYTPATVRLSAQSKRKTDTKPNGVMCLAVAVGAILCGMLISPRGHHADAAAANQPVQVVSTSSCKALVSQALLHPTARIDQALAEAETGRAYSACNPSLAGGP